MVHEAMILEYTGRHLALMEWGAMLKLMIYSIFLANIFLPWGIADNFSSVSLLMSWKQGLQKCVFSALHSTLGWLLFSASLVC